jgi:hypothetical protein
MFARTGWLVMASAIQWSQKVLTISKADGYCAGFFVVIWARVIEAIFAARRPAHAR